MAYAHNAGLNFYDGIVDVKPPLLIYLTSFGLLISPSVCSVKWFSLVIFATLILVIYVTLVYASGRSDIACFGATLVATNWALRHYGVVELSQSFWQAMLCLFSLIAIFGAITIRQNILKSNQSHRILIYVLLFFGGFTWAVAFYMKQQAIVVLPGIGALILLYPGSCQAIKEKLGYLSMFTASAIGCVVILYYPILGNSPLAESYKYIFLSNMASTGSMSPNDYRWWSEKGSALLRILSASARIPVVALVGFETQVLIDKQVRIRLKGPNPALATSAVEGPSPIDVRATIKRREAAFLIAMTAWALSAVIFYFLHNRTQSHYLLEMAVSLTIIIPLLASACRRYSPLNIMLTNVTIMAAIILWHGIITDPIGSALRDKWKADRQVAEVITASSDKKDKLLLFTNPVLYWLADRLPASRFPFFVSVWNSPALMPEYRRATVDGLTAETTKVVVVHERVLAEMPDWLKSLVIEELTRRYRVLTFQSDDALFGTTKIYVRNKSAASLSAP
jgi:hypothetical protein